MIYKFYLGPKDESIENLLKAADESVKDIVERETLAITLPIDDILSRYGVNSIEEEEMVLRKFTPYQDSLVLKDRDVMVPRASVNFVADILNYVFPDSLPRSAAEYGAGAAAVLFQQLPPEYQKIIELFDINQDSVNNANSTVLKNFNKKMKQGSFYDIDKIYKDLDLVIGKGAWDGSLFLKDSMKAVYNALSHKGAFIHIQDVTPTRNFVLVNEAKYMLEAGIDEPVQARIPMSDNKDDPFRVAQIFSHKLAKWVSSIDYFNLCLEEACQSVDFETQVMDVVGTFTGERLPQQSEGEKKLKNVFLSQDTIHFSGEKYLPEPELVLELVKYPAVIAKK